ncbi:hypothetical protein OBV_20200 [Oscillibacter valericigenes Sjm18-20]|nr:hypothetical protein OBV_20200 [Oscillibacter valericigenes Sjm18-20]
MNTTANLGLRLPAGNEYADVADLNYNFEKIDAAMAAARSAEEYNPAGTYAVGDYCTKDGKLYRCTTAITVPEAWNAAHWAETTISAELKAMLAHIEDKNNPHGVTPAQIGAATTAELEAALANTHRTGEIMLASSAVSNLPDNVLPCTGGFYDKSAFSELHDVIGVYAGVKFPSFSDTGSSSYLSYILVGYDRIRHEIYVQAETSSTTIYVLDKTAQLIRTITLPYPHRSDFKPLSVYDGVVAYDYDGKAPAPDVCCVSLDGGITFSTHANVGNYGSSPGMSKTKVYFFHTVSPLTMIIFDKLTGIFSTKSLASLPTLETMSFTNDSYCFLLREENNSGVYYQTFQYIEDKINPSDIDDPVRISLSAKGSIYPLFTSFKDLFIGIYRYANTGVTTVSTGDLVWYDPRTDTRGTVSLIRPSTLSANLTDTNPFSENNENLYFLSSLTNGYYGVCVSVNQETHIVTASFALVESTGSHLSGCKLAVVTDSSVLRASCGTGDYQDVYEIGTLDYQFRVPDISNIQGTTAYIYTGEE